jgi:hypothetical protein
MSAFGFDDPNSEPFSFFSKRVSSPIGIGTPTSVMSPRPVTTTVPCLRIEAKASPTCSGFVMPMVTMETSAPWPLV